MKTIACLLCLALCGSLGLLSTSPSVGEAAPDLELMTPNNESVSLSSLQGKVVLLDFWASWCRPCCAEISTTVLPAYEKYHEQGFEVYAVSLDQQDAAWKNAIEKFGLPWINVSDLKGFAGTAAQSYNVRKIPSSYLLDETGKVIAVDLRGQGLLNKLDEVFGKG